MSTAASAGFARTKIQAPCPQPDLVPRAGLDAALGQALARQRLTLLHAGAGWGKTSALARQLAALPEGTALAWFCADDDDDLPRFLVGLTAALEPLQLPWSVAPSAMGTLSQGVQGLQRVVAELVRVLSDAAVPRGLIVVDDVHRIADPSLIELLQVLMDRLPPPWGLVLAGHEVPMPADEAAARRARQDLAEFGPDSLRFDAGDVLTLLHARGLPALRAAPLLESSDGRPAALRMLMAVDAAGVAALPPQPGFDALAEAVLTGLAPALQRFLLLCSVLHELEPARCAHVSAMPEAMALFEQVAGACPLVLALDAGGRTLRLHALWRDFLQRRLVRAHGDELPALLERTADGEPDLARSIGWLARAGAWARAATELAERGPALVPLGGGPALERLLALFPPNELQRRPDLDFLRGLCAAQGLDFQRQAEAMARAAVGYAAAGQAEPAWWARLFQHAALRHSGSPAQAAAVLAPLRAEQPGGPAGVMVAFHSAWEAYAEHRPLAVAPAFADMLDRLAQWPDRHVWGHIHAVSAFVGLPGMAPLLARFAHGAQPLVAFRASLLRVGLGHARAAMAFAQGQLAAASSALALADDDLQWLGRPRALLVDHLRLHLALDAARGDAAAVDAAAAELRAALDGPPQAVAQVFRRSHGSSLLISELRARWTLGDGPAVRLLRAEVELARHPAEWACMAAERALGAGMVALLDGRLAEAEQLLGPGPGPLEDTSGGRGSQALLLCAEAQRRQGRLDAAAALLKRWLAELRAGGPVGAVLQVGPAVMEALAAAPWAARLDAEDLQRLQALAALADSARGAMSTALTELEAEVLALIASGHDARHIGRELDLSSCAVQRHIDQILEKSGLDTPAEASAWWVSTQPQTQPLTPPAG